MARALPIYRPWITSAVLTKTLLQSSVLHIDLFAYLDSMDRRFFQIVLSEGGTRLLAQSQWLLTALGMQPQAAVPEHARPTYWTRDNNAIMSVAHTTLLRLAGDICLPQYHHATTHCHYIVCLDVDPWPRGMVNTYRAKGPRPKHESSRANPNATVPFALPFQRLPDLL